MLFNSLHFALFLPVVFTIYWAFTKRNLLLQNTLLLVSSYFFYGCWDWRFLFLLIFSTLLDYYTGNKIHTSNSAKSRKQWLWLSIIVNLGFLAVFKYYNFFAESFADALSQVGIHANPTTLQIILPVGISFYTFHGISYVVDIYNKKTEPESNIIHYSLFVSFFPLLVAGPIERATHLLPQLTKHRVFNYPKAIDGLKQILWGLFKKIVIADNCAEFANAIFNNSSSCSSAVLVLGAIFFSFQIYGDFSGYSDIAQGTARLFGIELLRNFNYPYFSRSIAEFWRRWHISLSSWFRDYLYIPLGGSQGSLLKVIRNTFIVFLVSGFWHGANLTFIVWGFINALLFLPTIFLNVGRNSSVKRMEERESPGIRDLPAIFGTFFLVSFMWIFFRSNDLTHALTYIQGIFSFTAVNSIDLPGSLMRLILVSLLVAGFVIVEWLGRNERYAIAQLARQRYSPIRWSMYYAILLAIFFFGDRDQQFIYFQF